MHVASIHLRLVEVSDEQGVFYLHGTLGAGRSRRGAGVETTSGDDLRGAGRDNIHSRWVMNCFVYVLLHVCRLEKAVGTPHGRSEAEKMEVLKLTAARWKLYLPHASRWGNNCITCSFCAVCWVAFMVFVSMLWHCCAPLRHCNNATFRRCSCPVLGKNAILGGRCKPREQLHYLFFPCYPVGSPSCCLFLRYDIVAHPCGTAAVLRFDAAVAPYCGKELFWAHTASCTNKWNVYVSRWLAVLTSWPFLLFLWHHFYWSLCTMQYEQSWRRSARRSWDNLGMRGVVPNNSDILRFKRC